MCRKKKGLIVCAILFLLMLIIPKYEYAATSTDGLWEYKVLDIQEVIITGYNGSNAEITIPSSIEEKVVTEIGHEAFMDNINITSVELPSTIKSIGVSAFYGCIALENIELNEGLVKIGYAAFCDCKYLESIDIPNTVTELGSDWETMYELDYVYDTDPKDMYYSEVFAQCVRLSKVKLSNNIKEIGWGTFTGCSKLEEIELPDGLECIGNGAFERSGLKSITIPDTVTKLGYDFHFMEEIDPGVFECCRNLTNVKLPKNINTIKSNLFKQCNKLTNIELPNNLTTIESHAFEMCSNLESITIPEGVTNIGEDSFFMCMKLTSINLPKTLKCIGASAFCGCESLTNIEIPEGITIIEDDVFWGCSSLTTIEIPNSVKSIGDTVFHNCVNLTSVKIPNSIISIGANVFEYCTNLQYLIVEKNSYSEQYAKEESIDYIYTSNNIKDFNISDFENRSYTGESIVQDIVLKNGTILLVEGTDYELEYRNNKNAGNATVVIKGKGNYAGAITKTFKINAKDISNSNITGLQDKSYNGQPLTQNIVIKMDDIELNEGIDYTKTYKNNTNAGTATIVITGKGNYTGTITKTFKINAVSFTNSNVSGIKDKEYTGKNLTQSITVKYGNKTLVKDKDYKLTYSNHKNPGKATVKITGIGNYTGTITKTFIIKPKKVSGFKVKEQKTDSIKLNWSKHTGVTGYKVYSYNYKKEKWEYVGKTSSTSYTIKKLKAGTTYKYRVRAYKTIDGTQHFGSYTSSLKTTTKTKTPSISKLTTKSKKVALKWKKVSGASGYQIYMATSKNGKYSKIKTITKGSTTSYTKTKLKKNKKYYFKIRTYRTVDGKKVYSSYSSVKNIKVK